MRVPPSTAHSLARRAYRLALRAFPAEFRERWGPEMELTFASRVEHAAANAGANPWRLVGRELVDVAVTGMRDRINSSTRPSDMFRLPKFRKEAAPAADDPHATPSFLWEKKEMLELYRYAEDELRQGKLDEDLWRRALGESSDPRAQTRWYLGARTTQLREIAEAQLRKEGYRRTK